MDCGIKFWTSKQLSGIRDLLIKGVIPIEVANKAILVMGELDRYYDNDRQVDNDDGGYMLLFRNCLKGNEKILKVLEKYNIDINDIEDKEIICTYGEVTWMYVLYLAREDYGITLIYPCEDAALCMA